MHGKLLNEPLPLSLCVLTRPASLGSSESDRPYEIIFHLLRGGQLAAAAECVFPSIRPSIPSQVHADH